MVHDSNKCHVSSYNNYSTYVNQYTANMIYDSMSASHAMAKLYRSIYNSHELCIFQTVRIKHDSSCIDQYRIHVIFVCFKFYHIGSGDKTIYKFMFKTLHTLLTKTHGAYI